jgi:hypothetical protein
MSYGLCIAGCFQLKHVLGKTLVEFDIRVVREPIVAALLKELLPARYALRINPQIDLGKTAFDAVRGWNQLKLVSLDSVDLLLPGI